MFIITSCSNRGSETEKIEKYFIRMLRSYMVYLLELRNTQNKQKVFYGKKLGTCDLPGSYQVSGRVKSTNNSQHLQIHSQTIKITSRDM